MIFDPRFAYLKQCKNLGLLPKAGMIIKKEETWVLNYQNFRMTKKTSSAVAEAIKRYPSDFLIEEANFMGNSL